MTTACFSLSHITNSPTRSMQSTVCIYCRAAQSAFNHFFLYIYFFLFKWSFSHSLVFSTVSSNGHTAPSMHQSDEKKVCGEPRSICCILSIFPCAAFVLTAHLTANDKRNYHQLHTSHVVFLRAKEQRGKDSGEAKQEHEVGQMLSIYRRK